MVFIIYEAGESCAGPQPIERQKYSDRGGFTENVFLDAGVPQQVAPCLVQAGNFALATNTWRTYGTVDRHIDTCNEDLEIMLTFPFSVTDILTSLGWLITSRKVRAKTVQVYLAVLRMGLLLYKPEA